MEQVNTPARTSDLTIGQAVKISGKSRSVIFRAIKNGQITATKNDKSHHLIDKSELARWSGANSSEQDTEQTKKPIEQPENNAIQAVVKAKDETISQQAERIAELKEQLEREQGRGDRLEARLLTDQRPDEKPKGWLKRLLR
jgi:hypothetical protein